MSDLLENKNDTKNQDVIQAPKNMEGLNNYNGNLSTPTELLVKFLTHLMTKNYEQALMYCTEILRYEPKNPTALEFYPLIVEKLEIMKREEDSSSDSSSSTSSSSSSENILLANESLCRMEEEYSPERHHEEGIMVGSTINISNSIPLNRKFEEKSVKDLKSSASLEAKPDTKITSNEDLKTKFSEKKIPHPSNLVVHSTRTTTLVGTDVTHMGKKGLSKPKQENQALSALNVEPPSKTILPRTQTITFPRTSTTRTITKTRNAKGPKIQTDDTPSKCGFLYKN